MRPGGTSRPPAGRSPGLGRTAAGRRAVAALAPVLLLLLAGGCAAGPRPGAAGDEAPSPFADCAALTAPPHANGADATDPPAGGGPATPADAPGPPPAPDVSLPDVSLPCFTGGATVALAAIRGPAVINIWASWCQPCRKELPAFQRLADRTGGRVHVVGVDTRDRRESARSLAADLGLTFPNLVDDDETLRAGLARPALPITLFVDGAGRIRHLHDAGVLDDAALNGLVRRHLGVATAS